MAVNRELAPLVDVMIGNEEDFTAALGFEVEGQDEHHSKLDVRSFQRMMERVVTEFPNFKVVATTLRNAKTATINDWGAVCYTSGELYQAPVRENLEILDRIGGGDSFCFRKTGSVLHLCRSTSNSDALGWNKKQVVCRQLRRRQCFND